MDTLTTDEWDERCAALATRYVGLARSPVLDVEALTTLEAELVESVVVGRRREWRVPGDGVLVLLAADGTTAGLPTGVDGVSVADRLLQLVTRLREPGRAPLGPGRLAEVDASAHLRAEASYPGLAALTALTDDPAARSATVRTVWRRFLGTQPGDRPDDGRPPLALADEADPLGAFLDRVRTTTDIDWLCSAARVVDNDAGGPELVGRVADVVADRFADRTVPLESASSVLNAWKEWDCLLDPVRPFPDRAVDAVTARLADPDTTVGARLAHLHLCANCEYHLPPGVTDAVLEEVLGSGEVPWAIRGRSRDERDSFGLLGGGRASSEQLADVEARFQAVTTSAEATAVLPLFRLCGPDRWAQAFAEAEVARRLSDWIAGDADAASRDVLAADAADLEEALRPSTQPWNLPGVIQRLGLHLDLGRPYPGSEVPVLDALVQVVAGWRRPGDPPLTGPEVAALAGTSPFLDGADDLVGRAHALAQHVLDSLARAGTPAPLADVVLSRRRAHATLLHGAGLGGPLLAGHSESADRYDEQFGHAAEHPENDRDRHAVVAECRRRLLRASTGIDEVVELEAALQELDLPAAERTGSWVPWDVRSRTPSRSFYVRWSFDPPRWLMPLVQHALDARTDHDTALTLIDALLGNPGIAFVPPHVVRPYAVALIDRAIAIGDEQDVERPAWFPLGDVDLRQARYRAVTEYS